MVSDGSSSPTAGFSAVRDGRILRVTISNPGRKNALSYQTMVALGDTFLALADDPSVRVVLLTGDGADFCTGADLAADTNGITPEMTMDAANRLVRAIVNAPVPVIARIRGAAAGVGVGIALAADLVYAADDSYLLLAFINIGLMPDGGAAALVAAAAGRPLATEMALLGKRLPAPAAQQAGLLTALPVDELDAAVDAAVDKIAHGPRRALELTKKALNLATLRALDEVLEAEKTGQVELLGSADFREGAAAMLTKRKAVFAD
ncbi:enoyl-CoA hydratase [Nocardia cyriacigeorgica]|uniref:Enoyl-CoA hydratase n=1 Tax=Nocardia cyriacigeorgica (strain GUH-2) TaxID=1127134 RepID=H6QZ14_NOCCG|nr:enoyl-CoA hydratase [Nocardia cyriacigeorgica]MBF6287154.1 enoyl-CoA hydratase [Nocardia cyriacigeorgica]MBF6425809.1 enoyl-CoA hydratase [Nocardia cyriacigeorgica]CCF61569.1 enoyl-CoA hydratase [Nocardia cyriacigeorgica GUH-2]BDT84996.1 putative enoyl-CoA hydratase/isomerase [Nocardia cyriacigeorgica]BDU04627.1 putative enoyl-CoA hydratase/isomerase [Nocardia cyriacigeorgica]